MTETEYTGGLNQRVPCISRVRTAKMMYRGRCIGTISEESNDAGETDWVIRPDYEVLDQDPVMITGIDLDLRKKEYIRSYLPEFVDRRTLSDVRPDLQENLARLGMDWNDRFEFMVRNHGRCGGSRITVERAEED